MIFFEWLEHEILEISDLEKCPGPVFQKSAKNSVWKNPVLPGSKISFLAIHKSMSHIWENRSRKVNNDQTDLRFFHGNFWPVISLNPKGAKSVYPGPTHLGPAWAHPFGFPDAAHLDKFSNPDPGPSQRTQGWNTSARKPSLLIMTFRGPCQTWGVWHTYLR